KDSQVELQAPISAYNTPTGTGAPPAITNAALGLSADPQIGNPSFNSRGLPCAYDTVTGLCTANVAFIKYFKDNRGSGSGRWAAISITPAGRIKRWFWNGSAWTDERAMKTAIEHNGRRSPQAGITIIETRMAALILVIGSFSRG